MTFVGPWTVPWGPTFFQQNAQMQRFPNAYIIGFQSVFCSMMMVFCYYVKMPMKVSFFGYRQDLIPSPLFEDKYGCIVIWKNPSTLIKLHQVSTNGQTNYVVRQFKRGTNLWLMQLLIAGVVKKKKPLSMITYTP